MQPHHKVAAIQMNSGAVLANNLARAGELVAEAAQAGARLVLLPEYFCLMGEHDSDRVAIGEPFGDGPIQRFLSDLAKREQVWLSAGTVPLTSSEPGKVFNSNLWFDDQGQCVGRYDKIHLFGFDNGQESYLESATLAAGRTLTTVTTPVGEVRASVCYDLRFPELYRQQSGYAVITAPAAFTYTTGQAHWELLLRSRAVENQCYVVAAAQTGIHPGGKRTFGHSMIVDPWGNILDCREEGEGIVIAAINFSHMMKIRQQLPALKNRIFN